MSDELKQFYREIWAWVQAGCPKHPVFNDGTSLCSNLARWARISRTLDEQTELFIREFGMVSAPFFMPFNSSLSEYIEESGKHALYQNPKRLAFIEEHAK